MGFSSAWSKFRVAFSANLLEVGQMVTKEAESRLLRVSEDWLQKTDADWPRSDTPYLSGGGDDMHPWFTGTLHDSIAIRIGEGMRTIGLRFMPMGATGTQSATAKEAGRSYEDIRGYVEGRLAAGRASRVRQNVLVGQLIFGAPYTQSVNTTGGPHGDHKGFATYLAKDYLHDITQAMATLGNKAYRIKE